MHVARLLPNRLPKPPRLPPLPHHQHLHQRQRQKMTSSRSIFMHLPQIPHLLRLHPKKILSKIFCHSFRRLRRSLLGHKHQSLTSSLRPFHHSAMRLPLPPRLGMSATIGAILSHLCNRMSGALLLLPNNHLYLPLEVISGEGPLGTLRVPVLVSLGRRRRQATLRRTMCSGTSGVISSRDRVSSVCTVSDTT